MKTARSLLSTPHACKLIPVEDHVLDQALDAACGACAKEQHAALQKRDRLRYTDRMALAAGKKPAATPVAFDPKATTLCGAVGWQVNFSYGVMATSAGRAEPTSSIFLGGQTYRVPARTSSNSELSGLARESYLLCKGA